MSDDATEPAAEPPGLGKWVALAVLVAAVGGLGYWLKDSLTLAALAERETTLADWGRAHPVLLPLAAGLVYVAVTALSLPGAAVMTLAIGWGFHVVYGDGLGFAVALLTVSFASTAGATIAFLLGRFFFRESVERRFGDQLAKFRDRLEAEGAFYLFTLRLIVVVPFFVVNLVMGLTPLRTTTFWWVSQLGMLPGTAAYVWFGYGFPSLAELDARIAEVGLLRAVLTPELIAGFAILGLFLLAAKKFVAWLKSRRPAETAIDRPSEGETDA